MREAVQAKCPNCTKVLRIPADMLDKSIRCKHCGFAFQAKKKTTEKQPAPQAPAPAPTARMTATPTRTTAPVPMRHPAPVVEQLPEYVPPATVLPPLPLPSPAANGHRPHSRVPAPVVESLPEAAPTHYTPAFEQAGQKHTGRGSYKRGKGTPWGAYAAIGIVTACALLVFFFVLKPGLFKDKPATPGEGEVASTDGANNANGGEPSNPGTSTQTGSNTSQGTRPATATVSGAFPRRMLAITASNYLYANAIAYGSPPNPQDEKSRRDFFKFMDKLAANWKIPADQRYYISDGPLAEQKLDAKHPPLKSVIAGSIDNFLTSCRAQDRIVIVFAGHAVEKDGMAYLVPQEGELEDVSTLIPVKEFYEKLAKCRAQEKLIIYDVCRFDPGRGAERPIFGTMTEGLEKALHDSPEGVSVWTSCAAGQYSYESDYYQVNIKGLRNAEIFGSTFFNVMYLDTKAALSKGASGKGIQSPNEQLPIQPLAEYVNDFVKQAMEDIENKPQTPKLTYKYKSDLVAYNPTEPLAAKIALTDAPPSVNQKEISALFAEFSIPEVKATRKDAEGNRLAGAFPFNAEDLKEYASDGVTEEEIKKNPEKYPLRAAVIEARDAIRNMTQGGKSEELPEEFRVPPGENLKKKLLVLQRIPATRLEILGSLRDKLDAVGKTRDMEKSKRWQANYDYMLAQVKARVVYINQYNLMLGKVRKDELPELIKDKEKDINQNGWRLAAIPDINGDADGKTMAKEVKKDLESLVTEHPRTPWALQAKRERGLALGLQWQGVTFK